MVDKVLFLLFGHAQKLNYPFILPFETEVVHFKRGFKGNDLGNE